VTAETNSTTTSIWTNAQAVALAIVSLLVGTAGGYLLRQSQAHPKTPISAPATSSAPSATSAPSMPLSRAQLNDVANTEAAAKLELLKADPTNVGLLTDLGNIYYDNKQYPNAIDYYRRALDVLPTNTSVRTDMATAIWYTGDADSAIAEFNKSLSYEPTKPDTLFNLGVVKWQGKHDGPAAIAVWQKLLDTNPDYENKSNVLELIAQAKK
jgi:cytochrome c-type biogenesis protein CcmH/NrfG